VEQEMGHAQPRPGETFSAELVSSQKLGSAKFKIPTRKRASNQPGDLYAASNMGGNEDATSIIYICGRHSPPPRQDLTTHTMLPTLDGQNDPTNTACTVLPPHTASPGSDTPSTQPLEQDSDALQHFSNEKYQQIERAPHPPFGDAHRHIDAPTALGREGSYVMQGRTAQKGGSFTQEGNGCSKGLSYTQDAYTPENTLAQFTAENMPMHYGEFTAQECGRIAEFLALYPWTEPRHGLPLTQSGKDHHLLLYNDTCNHLTMMLEALLPTTLPTAERNQLDMLRKISQQNML